MDSGENQAGELTLLLQAASAGDEMAADQLLDRIYAELLGIARAQLSGRRGETIQATALVHEAYLRLLDRQDGNWENRRNFFFAAARAMRDVVVEQARRRSARAAALRARGDDFEELTQIVEGPQLDVLALDEALGELEHASPRKFQLVQLRFFAGLTAEEAAEVLGVSLRTVERDWRFVRAHLHLELGDEREAR